MTLLLRNDLWGKIVDSKLQSSCLQLKHLRLGYTKLQHQDQVSPFDVSDKDKWKVATASNRLMANVKEMY